MNNENPKPPPETTEQTSVASDSETLAISFEELSQGQNEIGIEYNGQRYRLRATKNGRLILNK